MKIWVKNCRGIIKKCGGTSLLLTNEINKLQGDEPPAYHKLNKLQFIMKANYGYMDGSGQYFITIDTDKCIECADRGCLEGCPKGMFEIAVDDYDDEVAQIKAEFRKKLKYECAQCKPVSDRPILPCMEACKPGAVEHSW